MARKSRRHMDTTAGASGPKTGTTAEPEGAHLVPPPPARRTVRELPEAGAARPVLIRSVPQYLGRCCRCPEVGSLHSASDGHLYCVFCRAELVQAGVAAIGGFATVLWHECQKRQGKP